mmetsp:Transcript_33295/g.48199  ORF Transcript_33295/g.48199 Transcript_33295/m.48199 type:complete len:433 (+) Transcript_33295:1827-3125(+)
MSNYYSNLHSTAWLLNSNNNYDFNNIFSSGTEILSSAVKTGTPSWSISSYQIPAYNYNFTTEVINTLNNRPKASSDFVTGKTTAKAGKVYVFGTNIGYNAKSCGLEYWPPGPECPVSKVNSVSFPLHPAPESSAGGCTAPYGGPVAWLVNGVALYGWSDATSYQNGNVWQDVAMSFEIYDMDPCYGHAAKEQYHHHSFSPCLAERLNDKGLKHSPIYGFSFDGYPIYGPYQSNGVLAVSCWQKRVYSDPRMGCPDGTRSCVLVDPVDYSKGTVAVAAGPSLTSTVKTQSGNTISSRSGIYKQDYYFNSTCSAAGKEHLNQFNGHTHDDLGFHYHLTIDSQGVAAFPFGPSLYFYGCTSGSICRTSTCASTTAKTPLVSTTGSSVSLIVMMITSLDPLLVAALTSVITLVMLFMLFKGKIAPSKESKEECCQI